MRISFHQDLLIDNTVLYHSLRVIRLKHVDLELKLVFLFALNFNPYVSIILQVHILIIINLDDKSRHLNCLLTEYTINDHSELLHSPSLGIYHLF